ncbi:MAG: hypothetical protein FWD83_01070 [Promicromonosporaceae bacterium]|nr:hypothetical protein [Promicromonosporaceae bacterium]
MARINRTSRKTLLPALLACGALLLSACGSDAEAAATGRDWVPGPLDEFSMRIYGWSVGDERSQDDAQAEMDAQHRQVEEAIAVCMAEYGFNYIPNISGGGSIIIWGDDDDSDLPQWGSREFAEIFGYGISTDPWRMDEGDMDGVMPEVDGNEWFDPNAEQVEAMSEGEREAWSEALWGPPFDWDSGEDWDMYLHGGCHGRAQEQVWRHETPAQFEALEQEIQTLWEQVQADPRISAANVSWSSCMADEGHPGLSSADDPLMLLQEEWGDMHGWNNEDLWQNWDWDAFPEGPEFPTPDPAEVTAFTAREIAMAVADFDCRASAGIDRIRQEVDHDLQQQFVDRHRSELEAWASYMEALRND